jgi:hypothetical protein
MPVGGGADDDRDMHASRGLIALLVGTVAFFALWIVALKPGGSGPGGSPTHGLSGYKAAITAAHQAVQTSAAGSAQSGGAPAASSPAAAANTPASASTSTHATAAKRAPAAAKESGRGAKPRSVHTAIVRTAHRSSPADRLGQVQRAMRAHRAVAILFYNPAAADDRAVKQELAAVTGDRGRVVKLTVPLSEIANYTALTAQVPVNFSPTLVLVAPNGKADEIVGFSDQFEIAQRVAQALATH